MTLRITRQQAEVLAAGVGLARVSRQSIDVLAAGIGNVRVTRQYVEVLTECFAVNEVEVLSLTDSVARAVILQRPVSEPLGLIETPVARGPIYVTIQHFLALSDAVDGHRAVTQVTVLDELDFQEAYGRTISVSVSDTLSFIEEGARRRTGIVNDALTLVQTISAGRGVEVDETLDLEQTVVLAAVYRRTVEEDLDLQHACTNWIGGRRFDRQYSPFVGDGATDAPTPPTSTLAALPASGVPFQLVYPATGVVTDSCTLRAPNFGNKDRLQFNRINRETRGGTLVIFADPVWPKTQILVLSFSGLQRIEALALLTFLSTYFGQEIGLIDWESRYWRGVVTTTDPIVEDAKDQFSANFEFVGVPDLTWVP